MKIHLVVGYTGSGKTTAVNKACRILNDRNIMYSVINDDCCDDKSLASRIESLANSTKPTVVFVECSGICTDPPESILSCLRESGDIEIEASNVSTFVDAQLLLPYLRGTDIPLIKENKIIWEKQVGNAEILAVSKIDLLSDCQFEAVQVFVKDYFPSKQVILLDSYDTDLIDSWLEIIGKPANKTVEGDDKKGRADNTVPVRLDEEIEIGTLDDSAVGLAYSLITALSKDILQRNLKTEHFQFFLSFNGHSSTISHTALTVNDSSAKKNIEKSNSVHLVINGCVHASPAELRKILFDRLNELKSLEDVILNERFVSIFPNEQ